MKLASFCMMGFAALVSLAGSGCQGLVAGGAQPVPEIGVPVPGIASYVVVDIHDRKVVLAHAADQRRSVASLTKIATGVVTLDSIAALHGRLDEALMVPNSVVALGPSALGLQPGDQMSVRDALYCALMASDNAAAEALAVHVGSKIVTMPNFQGQDPRTAFVGQMNALAAKLGMGNTKFTNPHGLELGAAGYSTAADMARLAMNAINRGDFNFFVSQKERRVSYRSGGAAKSFIVKNTNELLGISRIDGVKTGTTRMAGPCLIVTAPRPATVVPQADGSTLVVPHRLVVVELAAADRFNQARNLLAQGWAAYDAWHAAGRTVSSAGELLTEPQPAAPAR